MKLPGRTTSGVGDDTDGWPSLLAGIATVRICSADSAIRGLLLADTIYYLPGFGGQLGTGLGEALLSRGFAVTGRETVGVFREMAFGDQVSTVAEDLTTQFWHEDARVIANSFGAYLFLHAQAQMKPYPGKVLLLSPIVGSFSDENTMRTFMPPRPRKLFELVESGTYPAPLQCEIHVGSEDWQAIPDHVCQLAASLNVKATVVPGAGHMLGKAYVGPLLDYWFSR